ncbi:MAG TPA: hypothetical protein VJ867_13380, partial [Gemmatimonadaceae bacterium]|nr:hypothetical protein [Gemmatimonadaceae bacterium]
SDYMMYAYLQLGRVADARVILDSLPAMSARFDPRVIAGAAPPAAAYFAIAAIPARYALERGAWAEAASLRPGATSFPWCDAMTHFARALGAAHIGDTATALAAVDSLDVIRGRLVAAGERYWSEQVAIQQLGAEAWLALARGDSTGALSLMRSAAAREDATEKSAVTPGPLAPARELLADMLAQLGRVREAEAEYRATLVREPNRKRAAEGLARMTAAR